jgi:hypothetical protein
LNGFKCPTLWPGPHISGATSPVPAPGMPLSIRALPVGRGRTPYILPCRVAPLTPPALSQPAAPNPPLRRVIIKRIAHRCRTLSFPPILSFTGRVSTPPLYPSSSCPHWATGAPLPPSEFEPLSSFLPLFGELTPLATIVLTVYLLSPLRGPLKLQEPFAAATDHRSTATVVTS